jgi:transporter family-2 protein
MAMPLCQTTAEVVMARGLVIAVIVGAGIAVQVRLLGRMSGDTGPLTVGLLVSAAGVAATLVAVAITSDWAAIARAAWRPEWVAAGALGAAIVAGLGIAADRGGTIVALVGAIAGQLVVGAFLDRFW